MQEVKYRAKGDMKTAKTYQRMREIKLQAADLADQGRWDEIDWTEYLELESSLSKKHSKKK